MDENPYEPPRPDPTEWAEQEESRPRDSSGFLGFDSVGTAVVALIGAAIVFL